MNLHEFSVSEKSGQLYEAIGLSSSRSGYIMVEKLAKKRLVSRREGEVYLLP